MQLFSASTGLIPSPLYIKHLRSKCIHRGIFTCLRRLCDNSSINLCHLIFFFGHSFNWHPSLYGCCTIGRVRAFNWNCTFLDKTIIHKIIFFLKTYYGNYGNNWLYNVWKLKKCIFFFFSSLIHIILFELFCQFFSFCFLNIHPVLIPWKIKYL